MPDPILASNIPEEASPTRPLAVVVNDPDGTPAARLVDLNGQYATQANNLSDLDSASTARDNLEIIDPFTPSYVTSGFYNLYSGDLLSNTHTPTEGQMMLVPFVAGAVGIDKIRVRIGSTAGSTGCVARMGIYRAQADGTPGDLVVDGGTVAVTTINAYADVTANVTLTRGLHYVAFVIQGAASTRPLVNSSRNNSPFISSAGPASQAACYVVSSVTGALPDPCTAVTAQASANFWAPALALQGQVPS